MLQESMVSVSVTLRSGDHGNLFARASADVIASLVKPSCPSVGRKHDGDDMALPEFLALEIRIGSETVYTSFNGGVLQETGTII